MSLKTILSTYSDVIKYILRFVFLYIVFSFVYTKYLAFFEGQTDYFTHNVAVNVAKVYHLLGIDANVETLHTTGLKLIVNGKYVAKIVEGCSAASLIILFSVFILSFGRFKLKKLVFLILGVFSIYVFNIIRIVFLGYVLYAFPQYQDFLHRVLFPALIYGWIVLLWIIYIKKIESYA